MRSAIVNPLLQQEDTWHFHQARTGDAAPQGTGDSRQKRRHSYNRSFSLRWPRLQARGDEKPGATAADLVHVRRHTRQCVVRIEMIDVSGSDQLMGDECGRGNGLSRKEVNGHLNDPVAILLREVRH